MSRLRKEWRKASKAAHIREFDANKQVWDGDKVSVPRLSMADQARFEGFVRKDPNLSDFNLALTRNRAAAAMAETAEPVLSELRKMMGNREEFKDADEEQWYRQTLQIKVGQAFAPYSEKLFGQFTREHMLYALKLSLQKQYGKLDMEDGDAVEIDDELVDAIFANTNSMEAAFVHAIGLADMPEDTSGATDAKNLEQLVEQELGAPLADSEKPTGGKSTTKKSSPSSAQSTESDSKKSGS